MTDPSARPRFTFGLRGLFVFVAICSVCAWVYSCLPNEVTQAELSRVKAGMPPKEVMAILGPPDHVYRAIRDGKREETWLYGFMGAIVKFEDDRCVSAIWF
jgi:hypothetical protein